ncbi:MAG: hypothetical protein D8M58_07505 [Calditrichaeota bacterium]|nr:MAG: hypothetical protein DWQ03_18985 [Calditrichota bacterium]MBL1205227.1 hypothetical protein [Calditrichota bacterium]NOG45056.1 hypothetical protein [Calditrichota bacterium]
MKNIIVKLAAIVAFILGLLAVIMGTRVLSGSLVQDYNVLMWLVKYNVSMGALSIFAGYLIMKEKAKALLVSGIITVGHISVLISLLTIFSSVVADQSVKAMVFRSMVWVVIFLVVRKYRASSA